MTEQQQKIIKVLEEVAPQTLLNKDIAELAGEAKIYPATMTSLVKKGLVNKVPDSKPAAYYIPVAAVGGDNQAIVDFISRATHVGEKKLVDQLGQWVSDRLPELVEQGVLVYHEEFKIYAISPSK